MKEDLIKAKKEEIARYEIILEKYILTRWYNSGRRHLEGLQAELAALEASEDAPAG